jgi:hypothetical protein
MEPRCQIVVHEADEPNAVVDLLNPERLTGGELARDDGRLNSSLS